MLGGESQMRGFAPLSSERNGSEERAVGLEEEGSFWEPTRGILRCNCSFEGDDSCE